jgi:ADP-ribose pyrophosphatase YjhB (NUDIX family)
MHTLGVAGVLLDSAGRVLLIRTARAGWELPGGRVEAGEDLIDALAREVREETGCSARAERLVAVHMNVETSFVLLVFRGSASGLPQPGAEDDSLEAAWLPAAEALQRVTHATERECLAHGLEAAPGVTYCAFRGPESVAPEVLRRERWD